MDNHYQQVAEAFSRKSLVYDQFGRDHENLTRMRNRVYSHLCRVHPAGGRLLELNAGTGLDAAEMVRRGYRVHATDLAPGMVSEIERKAAAQGKPDRLTVQQCSFTKLDQIRGGPFDGIYSNFGGLNCTGDLEEVTRHLPQLLVPGGRVTFVVMPPICPWELAHLFQDPGTAVRRLRRSGVAANVEGVTFTTHYFSVKTVVQAFGPSFERATLEGLSVVTPTADNKRFSRRHPRLYRVLTRLDEWVASWPPFRGWGDFFIISMRLVEPERE